MLDKNYGEDSFIVFQIAGVYYAIRSDIVQQLEMVENITPVPNLPPYVDGVMLSRGKVIPVVNMRVKFNLEKIPYDLKTRIIVVNINDRTIGIIVDSAREYLTIPQENIQPAPESFPDFSSRFLEGIVNLEGRLILILNLEEILKSSSNILIQGGIENDRK